MLSTLALDCPALESLDATFCGRLGKNALAWVVNSSPPLHTLVLSVCSHLDANALEALGTLQTLRLLDLSYTEIQARNTHPQSVIVLSLWCRWLNSSCRQSHRERNSLPTFGVVVGLGGRVGAPLPQSMQSFFSHLLPILTLRQKCNQLSLRRRLFTSCESFSCPVSDV